MTARSKVPDTVLAYADGSSLGNPGFGGWAYVVLNGDGSIRADDAGSLAGGSNNLMELTAAIMAFSFIKETDVGALRTDSQYVVKGVNCWRSGWQARGMRTAANKPVVNANYWSVLYALVDSHKGIRIEWVKGHAADPINNLVDALAKEAATNLKEQCKKI